MIFQVHHTHHKGHTITVIPKTQRLRVGVIRHGHDQCKELQERFPKKTIHYFEEWNTDNLDIMYHHTPDTGILVISE